MQRFLIFLLISFGVAAPAFAISTQQTSTVTVLLLFLIGSYAPALAAWLMISRSSSEEKLAFRQHLRGWTWNRWMGAAVLISCFLWLSAFGILTLVGRSGQPSWLLLATLPVIWVVNYGEEIGWRGYALPYLMKQFGPFRASLILGGIWVLFHLALYWQRPMFGTLASIIILLLSFVLTWMFVNAKSILPGTVFHAIFDAWTQVFAGGPNAELFLLVVVLLLIVLVVWMIYRFGRNLSVETVPLL